MENKKQVITASQRELILKQASITGEDGAGMIEEIEEAAANTVDKMLPADVYRVIDKCMTSLSQRAARRTEADRMVAEKEPERLKQIEAIREQAALLHTCRLNKDKQTEECVAKMMREAVIEYTAAVDQDVADGLDPEAAREWRERAREIVTLANLDMPVAGTRDEEPARIPAQDPEPQGQAGVADQLAPLKRAIEQARLIAKAANEELANPEEAVLRGFGKQLGGSRREIMTLSRNLVSGQPAGVATEAARLADEACENIRVGRELIRAALRDMGAASDISEASGPVRPRTIVLGRQAAVQAPAVPMPAARQRPPLRDWEVQSPPLRDWEQRPPLARPTAGSARTDWASQYTPANTTWAPQESLPRPRIREEGNELATIMRGMMSAQANDDGWPTFGGKYVEFPRFRKEWWAYRQTYHGHVRDELVCRILKEKSLEGDARLMVRDIDDLREVWETLNKCYDRPGKYISEALEPILKFRAYKPFDSKAVREFYSLLRAAMMGARKAGMLERLINDQTLPGILSRMPAMDWRQWAKERPDWSREPADEAFWRFVDQKWKDAINVAAAEPPAWGAGGGGGKTAGPQGAGQGMKEASKPAKAGAAAIHLTGGAGGRPGHGEGRKTCIFKEVMGCTGSHPPWFCRAFGKLPARERERLIVDNKLCPFCLLHDRENPCMAKQKQASVACSISGCKGKHVQKLHEVLKDIFREEGRVHVLQEDDGWEESEEAWELGEDEGVIVGAVRQEDESSWSDECDAWAKVDEHAEAGIHQVKVEEDEPSEDDMEEGLLIEGEEREYVLELLLREAPPETGVTSQPTRPEQVGPTGKGEKGLKKKCHKKTRVVSEANSKAVQEAGKEPGSKEGEREKPQSQPHNPETCGGDAAAMSHVKSDKFAPPPPTLRRECSAQ